MKPEQQKALREPFPAEAVGKLPKVTCKRCSDAPARVCDNHTKSECRVCHNYLTSAHLHLDYVGHAAITDRLLSVDPTWSWEPFALDANGLPAVTGGNLWIRLTVCGVTRPGVGDGKSLKEAIGDAIRNAAMRFGAGLDLWSKEDLSNTTTYTEDEIAQHAAAAMAIPSDEPLRPVERHDGRPATDEWATPPATSWPLNDGGDRERRSKRMFAMFREHAADMDRAERLAFCATVVGRTVMSSEELRTDEFLTICDRLKSLPKAAAS